MFRPAPLVSPLRAVSAGVGPRAGCSLRYLASQASSTPKQSLPRRFTSLPTPLKATITLTSLALFPGLYYLYSPPNPPLSPTSYSTQQLSSTASLSEQHKLISIPIPPNSRPLFETDTYGQGAGPGADRDDGEVTIVHIMIGAPDIQIERPYTPVNDPKDGSLDIVVKRVKGGEVGRLVHSMQPGDGVEVRGPLNTMSLRPGQYDRIVMVSTGTAIAPFLQLLSKLSSAQTQAKSRNATVGIPRLELVHLLPPAGKQDWPETSSLLPSIQSKLGDRLTVHRPPQGVISPETIRAALSSEKDERVIVLVCLPPALMKPFCGTLTRTLQQGQLTGTLADIGLTSDQVWKLE